MSNVESAGNRSGQEPTQEPLRGLCAGIIAWLLVSWIWVGVPLGWGVYQTVLKSLPLFQQAAAAPK